jgi:thiol-disulfide isomerase/thioredoxin
MNLFNDKKKLIVYGATILVAIVLIAGVAVYKYVWQKNTQPKESVLSSQDASVKMIDFINKNVLNGQGTATLTSAADESGVYKVKFNVNNQEVEWAITKDGKFVFPQIIDLTKTQSLVEEAGKTVGNFSVNTDEVCQENGKPIVYFFGSTSCPHCAWEKPIVQAVMAKFSNQIVYKERIDSEEDSSVFEKYSTGGIPTLVFGCKYYRVGSGEGAGEAQETKDLTAIACKLTGSKPSAVCDPLKSVVDGIE